MSLSALALFADPWSWLWWLGAGVLLVAELMSGTFYLLMIALGFAAAGLARLAGVAWSGQLVIAAALAALAIVGVRSWRRRRYRLAADGNGRVTPTDDVDRGDGALRGGPTPGDPVDAPLDLDIGAAVHVTHWDGARGRARYRGADWDVALADGVAASAGWYRIQRIDGIRLILEK